MLHASPPAAVESPVELTVSAGERSVSATYTAAATPPGHPVVAVLLLGRGGPWHLFARLAREFAAHGYPVLALADDEVEALPSAHDRQQALSAAEWLLRDRARPASIVLVAPADRAAIAVAAATDAALPGLALIGTHLPPSADGAELDVFAAAEAYAGSMLVLGAGEADENGGELQTLALHAALWREAREERTLELGVLDGPRAILAQHADHVLAPGAYVGMACELVRQWLERRFGPGYPRTWQGPPPAEQTDGVTRPADAAACVPLLATGHLILSDGAQTMLALPDGRQFALTPALHQLVKLIDGQRSMQEIAARLSEQIGRPLGVDQLATLIGERLAPLGVVTPDSRGEGGEDESGMTDILIRVYEPHDRFRALLDNLTRVTRSPYNLIACIGKRSAVLNQNVGLDRARTRYAVFLDDDVILTEGWLERLRETMDRTGAGAVSARQLRMDGSPLSTAAACGESRGVAEALSGGACFMFRTDLGLRFDERYVRSQWDDVDFMFQLYERGYTALVDGRADFWHHNDPKVWRGQNLIHFVDKWMRKGLLRGWAMYTYDRLGSAYMPCFGPSDDASSAAGGSDA